MNINDSIINYLNDNNPKEVALIERTLINYYSLKLNTITTNDNNKHMNDLYKLLIDLFSILSEIIYDECDFGLSVCDILNKLKEIYIKT